MVLPVGGDPDCPSQSEDRPRKFPTRHRTPHFFCKRNWRGLTESPDRSFLLRRRSAGCIAIRSPGPRFFALLMPRPPKISPCSSTMGPPQDRKKSGSRVASAGEAGTKRSIATTTDTKRRMAGIKGQARTPLPQPCVIRRSPHSLPTQIPAPLLSIPIVPRENSHSFAPPGPLVNSSRDSPPRPPPFFPPDSL